MANVIYRGPTDRQPMTRTGLVAGAYLPGRIVTFDGTNLTAAAPTVDSDKEYLILTNQAYSGQDTVTVFTSGDTAEAYVPEVGQTYNVLFSAATYAVGDPLKIDSNGRMALAGTSDVVFAWYDGTAGALSNNDLADVRIANQHAGLQGV